MTPQEMLERDRTFQEIDTAWSEYRLSPLQTALRLHALGWTQEQALRWMAMRRPAPRGWR